MPRVGVQRQRGKHVDFLLKAPCALKEWTWLNNLAAQQRELPSVSYYHCHF